MVVEVAAAEGTNLQAIGEFGGRRWQWPGRPPMLRAAARERLVAAKFD